jgi:hypothetical protein
MISIETVKKLNAERTQDEWLIKPSAQAICAGKKNIISLELGHSMTNYRFIAAGPTIADLAIRQAEKLIQMEEALLNIEMIGNPQAKLLAREALTNLTQDVK